MLIKPLEIPSVYQIEIEPRGDERGFFARLCSQDEMREAGLRSDWIQVNNSLTTDPGVVRGIHFQRPPRAEVKMVRCVRGAIYDVAVDLREGSETYGHWVGLELTSENRKMLYIPEGFGHGLQSLEPNSEIIYFNTAPYSPELEGGVAHNDQDIGIHWPRPVAFVSVRDNNLPYLSEFNPIQFSNSTNL